MEAGSITIDSRIYEERIRELGAALHQDASDVVRDEARMFLKAAMKISPPKTKEQGQGAIMRDMRKIFGVVSDGFADYIAHDFGTDNVQHWLTGIKGEKFDFDWEKLDVHGYGMAEWHKLHQNPVTGRTHGIRNRDNPRIWKEPYVVSESAFNKYAALLKKKVGTLKSAWAQSFLAMGGKVPKWVSDNMARNKGDFVNNLGNGAHPSVTMTNRADGVGVTAGRIQQTVQVRIRSITKRLKLIASGYGKDIAEKKSVRPKFFTGPESFIAE